MFRFLKRKWVLSRPFPDAWNQLLRDRVPVYNRLPHAYKEQLKKRMQVFLDEKLFEGCGGLRITEEIKIVIAAYASVLILEETSDYYGNLSAILVYPDSYVAPVEEEGAGGIVTSGYEPRSGEYWGAGSIVLAWKEIREDIYSPHRGQNVIYHEFSHLLDDRYGLTAGIDMDGNAIRDDEWTRVLAKAYRTLVRDAGYGRKNVLDSYGAKNPAELFSVATEAFFEIPGELNRVFPALYSVLRNFYGLDPTGW